jgi:hypothetical protein
VVAAEVNVGAVVDVGVGIDVGLWLSQVVVGDVVVQVDELAAARPHNHVIVEGRLVE